CTRSRPTRPASKTPERRHPWPRREEVCSVSCPASVTFPGAATIRQGVGSAANAKLSHMMVTAHFLITVCGYFGNCSWAFVEERRPFPSVVCAQRGLRCFPISTAYELRVCSNNRLDLAVPGFEVKGRTCLSVDLLESGPCQCNISSGQPSLRLELVLAS